MSKPSEPAVLESRLALLCRGVAEATWLAAVIGVALLFSPRAIDNAFDPYKQAFLRALGLFGLASLVIYVVDVFGFRRGWLRLVAGLRGSALTQVLSWLVLLIAASTLFSVDARTSLWGAVETSQGALSWAAGLILLALLAVFLRTHQQSERLVTTLMVASFAVSVLTLVQRAGFDPRFPNLSAGGAFGTFGNPIYLGGYLLMVIPLTVSRFAALWSCSRAAGWPLPWLRLGICALILVSQPAAFYGAGKRGPAMGLAAGLGFFVLLFVVRQRMRRGRLVLAVAATVVFLAGLVGMLSYKSADTTNFALPLIGSDSGRSAVWHHAPKMVLGSQVLQHPLGVADPYHWLRGWLGHGLETLDRVIPQHYANPDGLLAVHRFHNLIWDHGFSLGLVGLLAFILVLLLPFFMGFRSLGLLQTKRAQVGFWVSVLGCGAIGGTVMASAFGVGFAGLGAGLGLIAGLVLFASWVPWGGEPVAAGIDAEKSWLMMALLAALAGHLVDMSFAFETASTFTLLMVYLGWFLALQRGQGESATVADSPWRKDVNSALLVGFGLTVLFYSLCHEYSAASFSLRSLLRFSFLNLSGTQGHGSLMLLPLAGFWLVGCLVFAANGQGSGWKPLSSRWLFVGLVSVALGMLYAALEVITIARIGPLPDASAEVGKVLAQSLGYAGLQTQLIVWLMLLVLLLGWSLSKTTRPPRLASGAGFLALACAGTGALVATALVSVAPLRADAMAQWGRALENSGRSALATEVYAQAADVYPRPFAYRSLLVNNLLLRAELSPQPGDAKAFLARAESAMLDAQACSELSRASFYLGLIHGQQALRDASAKESPATPKAVAAFQQARVFEPYWEPVWRESGLADLALLDDAKAAAAKFARAAELGQASPLYWAEFYVSLAQQSRQPKLGRHYVETALEYFTFSVNRFADNPELLVRSHSGKGKLLMAAGRFAEATTSLVQATQYEPLPDRWLIEVMLAQAFLKLSDYPQANEHMQKCMKHAPPEKLEDLKKFKQALGFP